MALTNEETSKIVQQVIAELKASSQDVTTASAYSECVSNGAWNFGYYLAIKSDGTMARVSGEAPITRSDDYSRFSTLGTIADTAQIPCRVNTTTYKFTASALKSYVTTGVLEAAYMQAHPDGLEALQLVTRTADGTTKTSGFIMASEGKAGIISYTDYKAFKDAVTITAGLTSDVTTLQTAMANKQDKLTAGQGVTIDGNTISVSADIDGYVTQAEFESAIGDISAILDELNGEEV